MAEQKEKKPKAQWDALSTKIFCEVCVEEVNAGNRPNMTFNKLGWKNVETKFNERTEKNYTYKQLRNRWDTLKTEWVVWKQLKENETGLGYDPHRGTIDASPEWWAAKKKENPIVAKFEHAGLENPREMEILFSKVSATGETAWTPAAGNFFPEDVEVQGVIDIDEGRESRDDYFDDVVVIPTQKQHASSSYGKRKQPSHDIFTPGKKGKGRAKFGNAHHMLRQLDRLCDAVENYTSGVLTESSHKNDDATEGGIANCINIMDGLPGIEVGDELYMFGTHLFLKRDYRAMFLALPTDDIKLSWLKREYEREDSRKKY